LSFLRPILLLSHTHTKASRWRRAVDWRETFAEQSPTEKALHGFKASISLERSFICQRKRGMSVVSNPTFQETSPVTTSAARHDWKECICPRKTPISCATRYNATHAQTHCNASVELYYLRKRCVYDSIKDYDRLQGWHLQQIYISAK